jgi:hypothetical protein
MVLNISKRQTTFSIETSSGSEWISDENLEKFLGYNLIEFNIISSWNFKLG